VVLWRAPTAEALLPWCEACGGVIPAVLGACNPAELSGYVRALVNGCHLRTYLWDSGEMSSCSSRNASGFE
jgi:hypothetical protein